MAVDKAFADHDVISISLELAKKVITIGIDRRFGIEETITVVEMNVRFAVRGDKSRAKRSTGAFRHMKGD